MTSTLRTWCHFQVQRKAAQKSEMVTSYKRNTEANLQQKLDLDLFLWVNKRVNKLFKLAVAYRPKPRPKCRPKFPTFSFNLLINSSSGKIQQ